MIWFNLECSHKLIGESVVTLDQRLLLLMLLPTAQGIKTGLILLKFILVKQYEITDESLVKLQSLKQLQSLSLVGTKTTEKGIMQLKRITTLRELYLYQTAINKTSFPELKRAFPKTKIDTGGYNVPILQTDTTVVTLEQKK